MSNGAAYARQVATGVLADLGLDIDGWRVTDVVEADDSVDPPRKGLTPAHHVRITVSRGDGSESVHAHYTDGQEPGWAEAATAEQLQDHAIELLGGAAVPPCPGHSHPMQPTVVDGRAVWACPREPHGHRFPMSVG